VPASWLWAQGRSKKFILGGYNLLLHDTTVLYTSSLTTSAAISAHNNFQGLILGGYIYRYTPPRRYAPVWAGYERPKNSRVTNLVREVAHARKRNPLSDLDKILQGGSYPDVITYANFRDDRLRGLGVARGSSFALPIGFRRCHYNTRALV